MMLYYSYTLTGVEIICKQKVSNQNKIFIHKVTPGELVIHAWALLVQSKRSCTVD